MSQQTLDTAIRIAETAGAKALEYFRALETLEIEKKGHQDFVSVADREVELLIRAELAAAFPEDGIVGEEHAPHPGSSGVTWVIDPIDGTANFVTGIPAWCVSIAGVAEGQVQYGVIHDPCHGETYASRRGAGATLNGRPMTLEPGVTLRDGSVGVGYSGRIEQRQILALIQEIMAEGSVFFRNASGALCLAYVAAGRLVGYTEQSINAWDCLAGLLLVEEAGGRVAPYSTEAFLAEAQSVICATPDAYDALVALSHRAFAA